MAASWWSGRARRRRGTTRISLSSAVGWTPRARRCPYRRRRQPWFRCQLPQPPVRQHVGVVSALIATRSAPTKGLNEVMMLPSRSVFVQRSPIAAFLGGNLANDREILLAEHLGSLVANQTRLRICVSGYKGKVCSDSPSDSRPSFGFAVASGAATTLSESEQQTRVVTRISKARNSKSDFFEIGSVVEPHEGNEQSRRLSIISSADVVCLAGGSTGTSTYFDFGLALDRPTLPLPFFGEQLEKHGVSTAGFYVRASTLVRRHQIGGLVFGWGQ